MPRIEKSALVPYTPEAMFALVDAVERYPEFLPWCGGSHVVSRSAEVTVATIDIDYHGLTQSFTTENATRRPDSMKMTLRDGPFRSLDGFWNFHPLGEAACRVELVLDYAFANVLLEAAVGPVFSIIANTMIERFVARADALYGSPRGAVAE